MADSAVEDKIEHFPTEGAASESGAVSFSVQKVNV